MTKPLMEPGMLSALWARLVGGTPSTGKVPTYQADGTVQWQAPSGGGGGSLTVKESNSIVSSSITTLDFGTGFDVSETPSGEANIALDMAEAAYDNSTSGLTATDVQAAIDELAASGGESYDPVTNYCDFDDFDYQPVSQNDASDSRRSSHYGNTSYTVCVNGLPSAIGVWRLFPYGSYVHVRSHRGHSMPDFSLWLDSNPLTVEFRFKINQLADATYKEYVLCALADVNGWNGFARVIYWPDNYGTGHFYLNTKEGGVESSVQMTTQPVAGVWYTVRIVATLSSVSAYVKTTGDFTLEATSTSNIPDSARTMATCIQVGSISNNLTSGHYVDLDYRRVTKTLDR